LFSAVDPVGIYQGGITQNPRLIPDDGLLFNSGLAVQVDTLGIGTNPISNTISITNNGIDARLHQGIAVPAPIGTFTQTEILTAAIADSAFQNIGIAF
jgi:hypothetical protein